MKFVLLALIAFSTTSAFACSCMGTKLTLSAKVGELVGVNHRQVALTNIVEKFKPVLALSDYIRGSLTRDEAVECEISCSLRGTRVEADVRYEKDGQVCEGRLLKRARNQRKVLLTDIVCF